LESIRQEYKENEDLRIPPTRRLGPHLGQEGERIVYVRTLMADNDNEVGGRAIERVGTGQYSEHGPAPRQVLPDSEQVGSRRGH